MMSLGIRFLVQRAMPKSPDCRNLLSERSCVLRATQAYGKSSDVFSFGVIIWELTTLAWPWHEPEASLGTSSPQADVPEGVPGAPTGVPLPDTTQQVCFLFTQDSP